MILISAGLVLTAIVLLIAGVVLAKPFLVMWSIAVSVLSAVFLVIGALLRRHELFPGGGNPGAAVPLPPKGPVPPGAPTMPNQPVPPAPHTMVPHGVQQTVTVASQPWLGRPAAGPVPAARRGLLDDEAIVLVIPGRKRYHVAGCRQLAGRDHEELTHEEAREEGFTPCTTCLPEFTAGAVSPEAQEPAAPSSQKAGPSAPAVPPTTQDAPLTRPYVQGPLAPGEQTRPRGAERPPVSEPVAPPLRAAEPAASPVPASEIPGDPNATSWFSRDAVKLPFSESGPPAKPASSAGSQSGRPETSGSGAGPDSGSDKGSDTAGSASGASAGAVQAAGASADAGPRPSTQDERRAAATPAETSSGRPAEGAKGASAKTASESSEASGTSGREDPSAEPAKAATPSPAPQKAPGGSAAEEPAEIAEPVEPAETGPGRAGRPVPVGSTSAPPSGAQAATDGGQAPPAEGNARKDALPKASDGDGEGAATDPRGIPAVREQPDAGAPEMVKVIAGTRRFHSPTCPLIKGLDAIKAVGGNGVETISLADAEEAGMRSCSVCRTTG